MTSSIARESSSQTSASTNGGRFSSCCSRNCATVWVAKKFVRSAASALISIARSVVHDHAAGFDRITIERDTDTSERHGGRGQNQAGSAHLDGDQRVRFEGDVLGLG